MNNVKRDNRATDAPTLRALKPGNVFKITLDGAWYMVTADKTASHTRCVDLHNGTHVHIENSTACFDNIRPGERIIISPEN